MEYIFYIFYILFFNGLNSFINKVLFLNTIMISGNKLNQDMVSIVDRKPEDIQMKLQFVTESALATEED